MAIIWGIVALAVGWWIFKLGIAFIGAGFGLLFGKYRWDSNEDKFVEK